ncbi:hypothetical protein O3G_MSEX004185 [Manduca sexta]|uniref:Uncharacterized protein n=1 Tax=Manduca sexta TaxID=7130 RepID=A0A921YU24_MANSE|nr:hypothetical protein O3G_MSEX004185 [Manduca sexta]
MQSYYTTAAETVHATCYIKATSFKKKQISLVADGSKTHAWFPCTSLVTVDYQRNTNGRSHTLNKSVQWGHRAVSRINELRFSAILSWLATMPLLEKIIKRVRTHNMETTW